MLFRTFTVAVLLAIFTFTGGCSLFHSKSGKSVPQTRHIFSLPKGESKPKTAAKTETVEEFLARPRVQ